MSSNSKGTSSQGPVHRARSNLSRHGLSCIHASTNLHKIPPSLCGAAWFGNVQLDQTLRASNDEAHHFALSIESHVSFGCAETWDFSVCHFTLHNFSGWSRAPPQGRLAIQRRCRPTKCLIQTRKMSNQLTNLPEAFSLLKPSSSK